MVHRPWILPAALLLVFCLSPAPAETGTAAGGGTAAAAGAQSAGNTRAETQVLSGFSKASAEWGHRHRGGHRGRLPPLLPHLPRERKVRGAAHAVRGKQRAVGARRRRPGDPRRRQGRPGGAVGHDRRAPGDIRFPVLHIPPRRRAGEGLHLRHRRPRLVHDNRPVHHRPHQDGGLSGAAAQAVRADAGQGRNGGGHLQLPLLRGPGRHGLLGLRLARAGVRRGGGRAGPRPDVRPVCRGSALR